MQLTDDEKHILNITQEVMRHVTISLATSCNVDKAKLSYSLNTAAANIMLDPAARRMLGDLAYGVEMIGDGLAGQQAPN